MVAVDMAQETGERRLDARPVPEEVDSDLWEFVNYPIESRHDDIANQAGGGCPGLCQTVDHMPVGVVIMSQCQTRFALSKVHESCMAELNQLLCHEMQW